MNWFWITLGPSWFWIIFVNLHLASPYNLLYCVSHQLQVLSHTTSICNNRYKIMFKRKSSEINQNIIMSCPRTVNSIFSTPNHCCLFCFHKEGSIKKYGQVTLWNKHIALVTASPGTAILTFHPPCSVAQHIPSTIASTLFLETYTIHIIDY